MTRPQQGYAPVDSIYPHKGLNTLDPSTLSDPRFSPYMKNVKATDGIVQTRTGYVQLGQNLDGNPVMELVEWSTESGVRQLLAFTTKYQYRFDKTTDTWKNITRDESTLDTPVTYEIGSTSASDVVNIDAAEGDVTAVFAAGTVFRIAGSDNPGTYKVLSSTHGANTVITLDVTGGNGYDEVGTNGTTTDTASVTVPFTGDIDNPIDWVVGTDDTDTYLFVVNGVDDTIWTDGTNFLRYEPADINSGGGFVAYTVALLNNYLLFGNYETGGEKYVIWSNNGNFQESDGFTAGVNDDSGSLFLPDADGAILKLEPLGDRLVIYTENSIHVMSYVGGDFIFSQEQVVRETRLLSPRAIANLGPFHFYVSQENFYLFDGTRLLRTIGDVVQQDYREHVNLDLANQAFAFHNTPVNEVYFVIPTGTSEVDATRTYTIEYDLYSLDNTRWSTTVYVDRITSMGYFTRGDETSGGTGLTWDAGSIAAQTWATFDQTAPWNSGTIREGFPVLIMGDFSGDVFQTGLVQQDDGTNFESTWHSIDFTVPQVYASEYGRWIDLDIELRGSSVTIDVNTNGGSEPWTNVVTDLSLEPKWTRYKFPIDVFGETCRVRVTTTGGGFQLKWLRLWVRPGGAR